MDRREARAILESMKLIDFRFTPKSKATEALDLAIEALREKHQPPPETSTNGSYIRDGRLMHDLVYRGEAEVDKSTISKTETVDTDLISRQAAIEAFDGVKVNENDCTEYDIGYNDGIDFAISKLSVLPSAQPKNARKRTETHGVCSDCISRQRAIEALDHIGSLDTEADREYARDIFENIPSVTPTEQQEHGRLIDADKLLQELFIVDEEEWTTPGIRTILKNAPPVEPKPVCEDAISRSDTLKAMCAECDVKCEDGVDKEAYCTEYALVKGMPPVEPKRPKGEWILECDAEGEGDNLYRCSECGQNYGCQEYDLANFCPYCGADMKGEEE